jgi:hypothetical protein
VPAAHQMTRISAAGQGYDEWACTECERRLLIRRPPAFEKVVLERGDEAASHIGGTGLRMSTAETRRGDASGVRDADRGWLAAHGIEWPPGDPP